MVKNSKWIKILKITASVLMIIVLLTIAIITAEPCIEFPNVEFNRFWGFMICFFCLISFLITILIFHSFNKIMKWILMIIGIPTVLFTLLMLLVMSGKIEYEPRYDRYVAYRNMNKSNQYVVVQDYAWWKFNRPGVDTTLIDDYYLIRKYKYLKSMNVKGTWVKYDDKGKIIDTLMIK